MQDNDLDTMTGKAPEAAPPKEKDDFIELLKAMAIAALIAISIRSVLFEPFNIPSGSMFPSLLVGDYLFVEKYSYGYSKYSFPFGLVQFDGRIMRKMPERGDVVVFRQPKQPTIDYIKRIIGLPGDRIRVTEGILYINDEPVKREFLGTEEMGEAGRIDLFKKYNETLPNGVVHHIYEISDQQPLDDTREYKVPEGNYFAMGDNRDQSLDSRVLAQVGFVPEENLVGRASFLFFSVDSEDLPVACDKQGQFASIKRYACYVGEWPQRIRFSRIFSRVKSL